MLGLPTFFVRVAVPAEILLVDRRVADSLGFARLDPTSLLARFDMFDLPVFLRSVTVLRSHTQSVPSLELR